MDTKYGKHSPLCPPPQPHLPAALSSLHSWTHSPVELLTREVAVVLAHKLHKLLVHTQQRELLHLLILEQGVALGQDLASGAKACARRTPPS